MLGGEDGSQLREEVVRAMMEYKISSYRAIVASTTAILNTEHSHAQYSLLGLTEGDDGLEAMEPRLALVLDLLDTETEYLSQLQRVLDKYAEPFRKFTSLSAEDHRILFKGLEPIVSLSAMLTSKLDDAIESWDPCTTKIGNLFSRTYWDNYEDYANGYSAITFTLEEKEKSDPTFSEFLQLRQGSSSDRLEDLLSLPVQRIPEYDKYLNELLQETDPSHPDYVDLSRAAAKVTKMVKDREDELANMDEQKRMERVQDKFPHDDLQLDSDQMRRQLASRRKSAPGAVLFKTLGKSKSTNSLLPASTMGKRDIDIIRSTRHHNNFNRQYLMEGNVEFSRGMQKQERYLFLFSDLLLVAKQKSNTTFKLKHRIRVCELWIALCIDDITELTREADKSFVIGWPTINVVATFKSIELKETWLNKLKEQIQEERSKVVPKTLPLEVQFREIDKSIQLDVETGTEAHEIVKTCLERLEIPDNDVKEYQLWVKLGHDESPYPLCGHELPYSIKLSHLRDFAKKTEDPLSEVDIQHIMAEMQNNNRKYEFFLKHNKKSPKKPSLEDLSSSKPAKGKRKSPLISLFRKKDDKKPQGKVFGHQLEKVTTAEELIAKPVREMMTILFREGPYTIGILRKSCNARLLKELKQKLDDGEDCLANETWPPLVIGALLKDYLRSIPTSLLMEDLYEDWVQTNNEIMENSVSGEKGTKLKETLSKLPPCHYELLRHLMCVLYHIDKKSDENKMTAYNLSVCIAPSLLWPKGNPNPLATPPGIIQHLIEHCAEVFGNESLQLFGELVEQKLRQDSSTDSDSMHSVLSTHSNFRRDDSSLDSLDREILYEAEMDSSPNINKSHHFSPSNLSGDSGLILSDSQFYDEEGNGNDIIGDRRNYSRSTSQYMPRDVHPVDGDTSHSLDSQYFDNYHFDPENPVPPPRRTRRKGSDPNISPNLEYNRKPTKYMSQINFSVSGRYDKRQSAHCDLYKNKRHSMESLKSVEESSEADSGLNMKTYSKKSDMGTLIKSASGAHLFFEEAPSLFEFDNMNNAVKKRRDYYKQTSDSTMPMSPQSKYSLSSSRDSVLSDSSGSFMNRNNSPEPMSSSAETPDNEDEGMSQWLSRQAKYTKAKSMQFSLDDSELDMHFDKKPKINYLVSPRSSPKIKRRSPIPLEARRSFPMQSDISPKGSGSNSSKEAEDIIKSPKLTVTYCSQDSLDRRHNDDLPSNKLMSPHLDIYNNNSQMAMKQLNIYSSGLQGTSPPPRVVLQGINSQRRDNTPLKGNHDILPPPQRRRSSIDMGEIRERTPYLMQEASISTEGESSDSEEEIIRHTTMLMLSPLKYTIPQKPVVEDRNEPWSRRNASVESLSKSSSTSDDSLNLSRPDCPPGYDEAVQRNYLLKQGIYPHDVQESEIETLRQREASLRAKQLYEQSIKQFQEQKGFSLPSQQFEKTLGALGEKQEAHISEEEIETSSDDDQPDCDPRKLYEESLRRYMEEQERQRTPLVKHSSEEECRLSLSSSKGLSPNQSSVNLHRSRSDVGDISLRSSSRDSTPTKRPEKPPPYNDPPPYRGGHTDRSPASTSRHLFPKTADTSVYPSDQVRQNSAKQAIDYTVVEKQQQPSASSPSSSSKAQNAQVKKRKDNILISSRARSMYVSSENSFNPLYTDSGNISTDNSIRSAQSEIGRYRQAVSSDRSRTASNSNSPVSSSTSSKQSDLSASVFRPRASSMESQGKNKAPLQAKEPRSSPIAPQQSSQGPISYRNPDISKSNQQVAKSQPQQGSDRSSNRPLDASAHRKSLGAATKELPWSVKRLSNIFDMNKPEITDSSNQQSQSSSSITSPSSSTTSHKNNGSSSTVSSSSTTSHKNNGSSYTSPPPFQRTTDLIRSSTSSNSSIGSNTNRRGVTSKSMVNKYGPQARDSFSSTDDSDCSCRYSLSCRKDNNSLEELDNISFSDITYV